MPSKRSRIAVLAGDGIGPEVTTQAIRVLDSVAAMDGFEIEWLPGLVGGIACDHTGEPLPEDTVSICERSDAILFGSVGGPRWASLPRHLQPETGGLLALRKRFGLYANLRPVTLNKALVGACPLRESVAGSGFDILFVRELSGDVYFGQPKGREGNRAIDTMAYTVEEIERISRIAFHAAKARRRHVTSIDKANVLASGVLWREVVEGIQRSEFPDVALTNMYVDNAAMQLVRNPRQFDVILCPNLFGDILSDEAGAIVGSMGMLPSASLADGGFGLYEPAGGSAPDIAGKGIANPIAQILSGALLLRHTLGMESSAKRIEEAVARTLETGLATPDIAWHGSRVVDTATMGSAILERL